MSWLAHIAPIVTAILAVGKFWYDSRSDTKTILYKLDKIQETVDEHTKELEETKKLQKENRDGIRHTQRYRLQHDMYGAVLRGETSQHEYDEICVLYASYKSLGGNGAIDRLFERYDELPMK